MRDNKLKFGRYDYGSFACFYTYASGSVIIPIALIQIAQSLGFSLESGGMVAGGVLQVARTAPMVVTMLLSGFIAGRFGKRKVLGVSVLLMALGLVLCAVAPVYGVLLIALFITGIGDGVIEGLATPFVQDLHRDDQPGRYINFSHSFWSVGILITVLSAGYLLSLGVSWRILIGAVAILGALTSLLFLTPHKKEHQYPEHPEIIRVKKVWQQIYQILKTPRFWLFWFSMFMAGGGEFCLTFWCASYIQLSLERSVFFGGIGTAIFALGMIIGRMGWGYFIRQESLNKLIIFSAIVGAILALGFPLINNIWLVFVLLLLSGVCVAPFWPSVQSYCCHSMPELDSTMLFVLLSCAGVPGCGVLTLLMGYLGNKYGLQSAFYLVPACFGILALLIYTNDLIIKRKTALQ